MRVLGEEVDFVAVERVLLPHLLQHQNDLQAATGGLQRNQHTTSLLAKGISNEVVHTTVLNVFELSIVCILDILASIRD